MKDVYYYDDFYVGIFGSITFFGSFVFALVLGKIGDEWNKATAILIALVASIASVWLLISFRDFETLAFSSFLMGSSYVIWSLMGALICSYVPEASRGKWIAVAQTAALLAAVPSPYIGGILYDNSNYSPFVVAIWITPMLAIMALIVALKKKDV
jgi:MFS family permease